MSTERRHRVVIIGGGFGGLHAARRLKRADVDITLIDKRNFHLFQPLLYQVASGALSPADIATPLRVIFRKQRNVRTIMGTVVDIDPEAQVVHLENGEGGIEYDSLIMAAGGTHTYFGNDDWRKDAPSLKTIEDATRIRRNILYAFEQAEKETDPDVKASCLAFVIVGAGPTGVELAGALAEMSKDMVRTDFRSVRSEDMRVILIEGLDSVLPPFPKELSRDARRFLEDLNVEVKLNTMVTGINGDKITYKENGEEKQLNAHTVIWAAGIKAAPIGDVISSATGAETSKGGQIKVGRYLEIEKYPNIFVVGDLALYQHGLDEPLPQLAQVARQEGEFVADAIRQRLKGKEPGMFKYKDRGIMATIGRHKAVAEVLGFKMSGAFTWMIWLFVHLMQMVEYENKILVFVQWAWNYVTRNRSARLITEIEELKQSPKYQIEGQLEQKKPDYAK